MESYMRLKKWIGLGVIALFSFILVSGSALSAGLEVNWNSYQPGMKKIADEDKKGFILFYTDRCAYCKMMDQKTFSDDAVITFLNQNFVPIRVDAEEQRDVAKKYGVNKFPNTWFIAEDQSGIGKRPGFIPPELLLEMLRYIDSDSFRNMSFQNFMNNEQ